MANFDEPRLCQRGSSQNDNGNETNGNCDDLSIHPHVGSVNMTSHQPMDVFPSPLLRGILPDSVLETHGEIIRLMFDFQNEWVEEIELLRRCILESTNKNVNVPEIKCVSQEEKQDGDGASLESSRSCLLSDSANQSPSGAQGAVTQAPDRKPVDPVTKEADVPRPVAPPSRGARNILKCFSLRRSRRVAPIPNLGPGDKMLPQGAVQVLQEVSEMQHEESVELEQKSGSKLPLWKRFLKSMSFKCYTK